MSQWGIIKQNYKTLMETTLVGNTTNVFSEAKGVARLDVRSSVPYSVWNGAYIIQMNGMPRPAEYVNGVIDLSYNIRLQVGFLFNPQGDSTEYDNAVSDIEKIVKQRITVSTFQSELVNVQHTSTSGFTFVANADSQTFGVCNVDFITTARSIT